MQPETAQTTTQLMRKASGLPLLALLAFLLFALPQNGHAQTDSTKNPRFLFGKPNAKAVHGMMFYFQPQVTPVFGEISVMGFGGFSYIYNQRWTFGLAGGGLMGNVDVGPEDTIAGFSSRMRWKLSYFGVNIGRDFWPDKLVYASVNVHIGGGTVSKHVVDRGAWTDGNNLDDSKLFSLHPQVSVGLNLTSWMRAYVSGGYRYMDYSATQGATQQAMSGWTVGFGLAMGFFQPGVLNTGHSSDAD